VDGLGMDSPALAPTFVGGRGPPKLDEAGR